MIKLRRFRLRKCYFGVFGCKIQTKQSFKKTLTRFGTANSVKYENIIIDANKHDTSDLETLERENKGRKNKAFVLFIYLKLANKNKTAI